MAATQVAAAALHPHRDRLDELAAHRDAAKAIGAHRDANSIDAEIVRVEKLPGNGADTAPAELDADTLKRIEAAQVLLGVTFDHGDPHVLQALFSRDKVHADRARRVTATPPGDTIGVLVGAWVGGIQDEARRGLRSPDGAAAIEVCIGHFRDFVGSSNPPDVVTADHWARWFNHCAEMASKRDAADGKRVKDGKGKFTSWSADTAKKMFSVSRSFVKWLWTTRRLSELPRNLDAANNRFHSEDKDPATFTTAEVHTLLRGASGVHRLILLLSLNCGMYGKDVADLRKLQIDFEDGRVTRRRSKTRRKKGVPKVSYKLWPETLSLLKRYVNTNPDEPRALVTKSGRPWVWSVTMDSGRKKKSDNVATIFRNLKARVGVVGADKAFKAFRKTSATRIGNKERFAALRILFLGHKPREQADVHYVKAGRQILDKAIGWLRLTYKLDEVFPPTAPATDAPTTTETE